MVFYIYTHYKCFMIFALKFAYTGKGYYGYARQPGLITIEGEIIKTLIKIGVFEDTKKASFRSASRTDKNVSAVANVISFNTKQSKKYIFSNLKNIKNSIVFYSIKKVEDDFNPRFAKMRHYKYYFKKSNYEIEDIISLLSIFTGKHNFSNFARVENFKDPVRLIENIVCEKNDEFFIIDFYAPNFLWSQIRRIISALSKVLNNKVKKEEVVEALENPNKIVDFGLAAAEPLILQEIFYDFEFETDKNQIKKVKNLEAKIISQL